MKLKLTSKTVILFLIINLQIATFIVAASFVFNKQRRAVEELHEEIKELDVVSSIKVKLIKFIMPIHDFISNSGKQAEIDTFKKMTKDFEHKLITLKKMASNNPKEQSSYDHINKNYHEINKIALQIFAFRDPDSSKKIIKFMKQMDYFAFDAIKAANNFVDFVNKEVSTIIVELDNLEKLAKRILLYGIALNIFFVSAVFIYIRSKIILPIIALRDAHLEVKAGNLEKKADTTLKDEIGELGSSFNEMTSEIKRSKKGLEQWIMTLEEEVAERTSEFISLVSHELRTPLASIKNSISLLLNKSTGKINKNQENFLSIADRNLNRLQYTIDDLLDMSKIEAGKLTIVQKKVDLNILVDTTIELVKNQVEKKNISLKKEIPPYLPSVIADSDRLIQIIHNLLENAIKFANNNDSICISALQSKDFVKVTISDTGIGIPQSEIGTIFDKFHQVESHLKRTSRGTGLGLPVVKKLVELHNGSIWVESKINKGSKFIFTLPIFKQRQNLDEAVDG